MSSKDIKDRVLEIEQAIKHLDTLKKELRKDASDIKTKMHARMSHMAGLLGQVDQTLETMEEALQIHIVRLNRALGVLQTGLPVSLDGTSEKELTDALEMLNKIQLISDESADSFSKTGDFTLGESAHNYSTDNVSYLPLFKSMEVQHKRSAFMSRHLDGNKDVKRQNQSLDAVKKVHPATSNVTFEMPVLSNCVEDWLQKVPASNTAFKDTSIFAKWRPAPYPNLSMKPAGRLSQAVPSACTPAGTSSSKAGGKDHGDYPQSVRKNLKSWLSHGSGSPSSFSDSLFKHIPTDKKMWLRQAFWQMNSLKEVKGKDFFQHISKESSSWLQTRAHMKKSVLSQGSQDGADFFSHINKDTASWLQSQNKSKAAEQIGQTSCAGRTCDAKSDCCGKTCAGKEERWLSAASRANASVLQLKDCCRANEVCKNLSECVSQPDCLTLWFKENSAVKNQPVPMEIVHSMSSSLSEWLSPAVQNQKDSLPLLKDAKVTTDLFHHIRAAGDPMWLMKSGSSTDSSTAPSSLTRFKDNKEEANLWLQKTGSPTPAESGEGQSLGSTSCDADWLMVAEEDKNKHQELAESEGWSVCSDSHSINTDQFDKNLMAADEYFSKWLMLQ
ncbi:unnamed protein product [Candidula unifasciata]|uniref:Nuclear receptor coactivator 4 n=1 Tax=Candidula unifasciata TaxID=100452 RepID=A0A8S3ZMI9_9EUPU|nr:unnamed protein product [Candidula unifasciata]